MPAPAVFTLGSQQSAPQPDRRAWRELKQSLLDHRQVCERHAERCECDGRRSEASGWRVRALTWQEAEREVQRAMHLLEPIQQSATQAPQRPSAGRSGAQTEREVVR